MVERLLPLYLSAAEDNTFINLDMEEYRATAGAMDARLGARFGTAIDQKARTKRVELSLSWCTHCALRVATNTGNNWFNLY